MTKRSPLERVTGVGSFLTIRGKEYETTTPRLRHLAQLRAYLQSKVPDPVQELAGDMETFTKFPPDVQKALAEKALEIRDSNRRNMLNTPITAWGDNVEGAVFLFWILTRKNNPQFAPLEAVREVFPPDSDEDSPPDDKRPKGFTDEEQQYIYKHVHLLLFGSPPEVLEAKKKSLANRKKLLKGKRRKV